MEKWIRSRKNAGLKQLDHIADMKMAKELFEIWDNNKTGKLTAYEI